MAHDGLNIAKKAKNDEFYTQYADIEKEVNAYLEFNASCFKGKTLLLPCDDPEWSEFTRYFVLNFDKLGLKKLISTSYAPINKDNGGNHQVSAYEQRQELYDARKSMLNGKVFTLTQDCIRPHGFNAGDLEWKYLEGDGDFRSEEVSRLRDEADVVVTNPPFSLFREFLAWLNEGGQQYLLIGHMNAIIYKEIFPLMKSNRLWLGATNFNRGMYFRVPSDFVYADTYKFDREQGGVKVSRVPGVCWFTNIEHGRRHEPIPLMNEEDVIRYSTKRPFQKYDNYDAIEIPSVKDIPSDYEGVMGVPISFMDKYCPEQFAIVGSNRGVGQDQSGIYGRGSMLGGKETFKRLFIQHLSNSVRVSERQVDSDSDTFRED